MNNEVIISPIEGQGYIIELIPDVPAHTIEVDTAPQDSYAVVVTDIEETETLEVVSIDESQSIEVLPQDISGEIIELQPVVHDGYIIEIFGGVQGGYALPVEYPFSHTNVVNVAHGRYKQVFFEVVTNEGEPVIYHKVIRRENDFDVFIYPKSTGKVIVYP